ncbi:complex 1 protein [Stagonosporopsis vannaccii]|nr:complex 1 protein [Stagonosporopsis vannaccii]
MSLTQVTKGDMPYQVRSLVRLRSPPQSSPRMLVTPPHGDSTPSCRPPFQPSRKQRISRAIATSCHIPIRKLTIPVQYRSLLRQSSQFAAYNFREYAKRRTRDAFREHQKEAEERRIQELMQKGLKELQMLKRQTVISQFYQIDRLVVEGGKEGKQTGERNDIVRQKDQGPGRGQIEHNVLEGLPINQYREIEVTVGPNTTDNKPIDVNAWPELPMPRDSHMLPEHSQQLLRAARSGRTIKPPAPPEDDENEMKDEETEHKEVPVGFTVKKYVKVARHNEAPEPEYLAKRRKGLPSQYVNGQVQGPLRETKIKKLDAEGNIAVYKVLAPEGQVVEGEVAPTDAAIEVAPVIAAPGTVVEGVGVVNAEGIVVANDILHQTPPRRRPPPPKKKKSKHLHRPGPGRGRKKVDVVEGAEGQETPAPAASGDIPTIRDLKAGEGDSVEPSDRDTPMGEAGEDDESGDEGSEDEEQDHDHNQDQDQDQENGTPATPSKAPVAPISDQVVEMTDAPEIPAATGPTVVTDTSTNIPLEIPKPPPEDEQPTSTSAPEPQVLADAQHRSSSPDLPLSTVNHSRQNSTSQLPTSTTTIDPVDSVEPVDIIDTADSADPVAPVVPEPIAPERMASEPAASELVASEPVPAPVPSTETESVPASVEIPASEPVDTSVSVPEPEPTESAVQREPSVPPSESTPDLLGSLEAELDKKE